MAPPTTVVSSVLLAVGNTPSMPRLKQLAQTITDSHSRNLGLDNTVFGRVKQVRLSSILQHSLHGGDGSGTSVSPSHAPLPYPHPNPHHHHHDHHDHSHDVQLAPAPAIEKTTHPPWKVAPAPQRSNDAKPPANAPYISPHYSPLAPEPHANSPATAPVASSIPSSSPYPNFVFAHVQPPSSHNPYEDYSDKRPSVSPSPFPSSADSIALTIPMNHAKPEKFCE